MSGALVFIDKSQFPETVEKELIRSLRARALNHKLHYESYKQAAKWLALHDAFSPSRTDPSCATIYSDAFQSVADIKLPKEAHVIGLGCGGGQKEAALLQMLAPHRPVSYTAVDASLPLVLTARTAALPWLREGQCRSVVCDLGAVQNLQAVISKSNEPSRIVTLFGVIPNFVLSTILARVATLLRPDDLLLLSANLADGVDYAKGVAKVLPQYDNELTRDWLATFLLDIGFERDDGEVVFDIETDFHQLRRVTAYYRVRQNRGIALYGKQIQFSAGETIRLFFSYRHTLRSMSSALAEQRIELLQHWTNAAGEEGVFLCRCSRNN
jgi:uncharacterized SAM-dependent methyltransferase